MMNTPNDSNIDVLGETPGRCRLRPTSAPTMLCLLPLLNLPQVTAQGEFHQTQGHPRPTAVQANSPAPTARGESWTPARPNQTPDNNSIHW